MDKEADMLDTPSRIIFGVRTLTVDVAAKGSYVIGLF